MRTFVSKLLEVGGPPLAAEEPRLADGQLSAGGPDVAALLRERNGFYAFEGALHVFPASSTTEEIGLNDWNAPNLWKMAYGTLAPDGPCFAEDVFGGQFVALRDGVYQFDPETGDLVQMASNIDGWARAILEDYELLTGYPLAHAWQQRFGAIRAGMRLLPKIPFVLGGEYVIDNLHALDKVKGMRWRGSIATQLRDLPDGAEVKIDFVD